MADELTSEHLVFDADAWLAESGTTVEPFPSPVGSAIQACELLKARRAYRGHVTFTGKSHVFVWAVGEPHKPHLTKIGGLPYLAKDVPWPVDSEGRKIPFCCQFCFRDSKHIVNCELPGDVMLIFGNWGARSPQWQVVWQDIGEKKTELVTWSDLKVHSHQLPLFGYLWEVDVCGTWQEKWETEEGDDRYLGTLFQPWATQICREPFAFAESIPVNKQSDEFVLCSLAPIGASKSKQPAFANSDEAFHSTYYDRFGYVDIFRPDYPFDGGTVYLTFDPATKGVSFHHIRP